MCAGRFARCEPPRRSALIIKSQINSGRRRELYHFRDQRGFEVDFLVPGADGQLNLIEVKASRTVFPAAADSVLSMRRA